MYIEVKEIVIPVVVRVPKTKCKAVSSARSQSQIVIQKHQALGPATVTRQMVCTLLVAVLVARLPALPHDQLPRRELHGVGVSTPFAAWRSRAARGACGVTHEGDAGDCRRGTRGSFGWPGRSSRLADAVGACLHSCSQCSQCHYISVSARFSDCSWYSSCELSQLRATANTKTFLSGPAAPPWNASSSNKKGARRGRRPNSTACPANTSAGSANPHPHPHRSPLTAHRSPLTFRPTHSPSPSTSPYP